MASLGWTVLVAMCLGLPGRDGASSSSSSPSSVFGSGQYVEYRHGDPGSRVVVTAPHGGQLRPAHIPSRSAGCLDAETGSCTWRHDCGDPDPTSCRGVISADLYTKELAELLTDHLTTLLGKRPHLVICHLHRSKMDANRDVEQATFGVSDAITAWQEYHGFVNQSKAAIPGRGLLLDIHGQAHSENWVELGYLFTRQQLDNDDLESSRSSIRHMAQSNPETPFTELLRGEESLGGLLQAEGYKVVPSPAHPGPNGGKYYSGGFTTKTYGSRDGGEIDAIQIESPRSLRSAETSPAYAEKLAKTVRAFIEKYYPESSSEATSSTPTDAGRSTSHNPVTPADGFTETVGSRTAGTETTTGEQDTNSSSVCLGSLRTVVFTTLTLILAVFMN